jgi:hypothetical protein
MSALLIMLAPAVSAAVPVLALRRRQSQLVPARARRPENRTAAPAEEAPRRPRGCNW